MSLLSENVATVVGAATLEAAVLNVPVDTVYTDGVTFETLEGSVNLGTTTPVNEYYLVIDDATGEPMNLSGKLIQSLYFSASPEITGTDLNNVFFEDRQLMTTDLNNPQPFWFVLPPKTAVGINSGGIYLEYGDYYSLGSVTNGYPYLSLYTYSVGFPVPTVTGGIIRIKVECAVV